MDFARINGNYNMINLLRGMLVGAAVSIFFIALKYLPLADAIAIFFVEPLIVLLLSAIFLGEKSWLAPDCGSYRRLWRSLADHPANL